MHKAGLCKQGQEMGALDSVQIGEQIEVDEGEGEKDQERTRSQRSNTFECGALPGRLGIGIEFAPDVEHRQDKQRRDEGDQGEVKRDEEAQQERRHREWQMAPQDLDGGEQIEQDDRQEYRRGFDVSEEELQESWGDEEGQDESSLEAVSSQDACGVQAEEEVKDA